jgi:hypothetical protein
MSGWKDRLFEMDMKESSDMNEIHKREYETQNNDVGVINPINGSGILVRDNKRIDAFSDFGLGFRIDPETQSFSIFAPTIKFFCHTQKTFDYEKTESYLKGEYKDALDTIQNRGEGYGISQL